MKNRNQSHISLIISLLALCCLPSLAYAEKFKVTKIKGTRAIIETNAILLEGETYEIITDESISQNVDYKSNAIKPRNNSITLGGELNLLKTDSFQSNSYSMQLRYGWSFTNLEIGTLLNITSLDVGAGATTSLLAGGYYDHNFVTNREPRRSVYGIFTMLGFGSTSYPSSSGGGSSSVIQLNGGGFLTYFIGNSSTALRGEAYAVYQQVNTRTSQSGLLGVGARGLLVLYF